jgi:hypothetical protein
VSSAAQLQISQVAPGCLYTVVPESSPRFPPGGGTGTFTVVASPSSCQWTATSRASWITIQGSASGTGTATVTYLVAPDTGPSGERESSIVIAGLSGLNPSATHVVLQW